MPSPVLLALVFGTLAAFQVAATALALRWSARWWKGVPVSLRRAVPLTAAWLAYNLAMWVVEESLPVITPWQFAVLGAWLAGLIGFLLILKRLLRVGLLRSLGVFLTMTLVGFAMTLVPGVIMRVTLLAPYKIPTGAMAPAILGLHADITCPKCGRTFVVGASQPEQPGGNSVVACPGCAASINIAQARRADGDHIFVNRVRRPARWDPIVFKFPENPREEYVKRLIGLPGERVQIAQGDIFINGVRARKEPGTAEELWTLVDDWRAGGPRGAWQEANGGLTFAHSVTDALEYNATFPNPPAEFVRDLKLEVEAPADANLTLSWASKPDRVRAVFERGAVVLQVNEQSASSPVPARRGAVCLMIRDGRAYALVSGRVVSQADVGSQDVPPDDEPLAEGPAIAIEGGIAAVARVRVWRDVHFRTRLRLSNGRPVRGAPARPCTLGADEYFVLGDNSAASFDSRLWERVAPSAGVQSQPGAVPGELIIGPVAAIFEPTSRFRIFR